MKPELVFAAVPAGSLIAVVAPAGPADPERLARVPALYERFGYRCRVYPGCQQNTGYLAGSDDVRLTDLHAALADRDVAAIHALRGGYGCMRILDGVDAGLVRAARKLLIGYSDITALHALWAREGVPSLHAPMPGSDLLLPGREADADALFALLKTGVAAGSVWSPDLAPGALRVPGVAEGPLIGGNLSLVTCLLGTPWAWSAEGAILFLEDINEEPYRVDRLLTQLRLAGVLQAAAGFLLGSFTEGGAPEGVLQALLGQLGKPVLGGWPAGHGTPNQPLPLGLRVRLAVHAKAASLTWCAPAEVRVL
jgi:muramoyltetrapeptide carboxypeptidase